MRLVLVSWFLLSFFGSSLSQNGSTIPQDSVTTGSPNNPDEPTILPQPPTTTSSSNEPSFQEESSTVTQNPLIPSSSSSAPEDFTSEATETEVTPSDSPIIKVIRNGLKDLQSPPKEVEDSDTESDYEGESDGSKEDDTPAPVLATASPVGNTVHLLEKLSKMTTNSMESLMREILPTAARMGSQVTLSSECMASLFQVMHGIRKQETWSWRLLDSYGRLSPGTFDGSVSDFGDFDECLDVKFPAPEISADDEDDPEPLVVGKYCMMKVLIPMPPKPQRLVVHRPVVNVTGSSIEGTIFQYLARGFDSLYTIHGFRYGFCIPSSCSAAEIELVLNQVILPVTGTPISLGPEEYCSVKDESTPFTPKMLIAYYILLTMCLLMLALTTLDVVTEHFGFQSNESRWYLALQGCSILRNVHYIFHIEPSSDKKVLSAVHGLRTLSMVWIIIGHTYCFGGFYKLLYTFRRLAVNGMENPGKWLYQPLLNTFLLVDSFFFLGGLVLMYVTLPIIRKREGKFSFLQYTLHRWIRLTPAMIGTICFITIMPAFGSGPIWKEETNWQSEACQDNYWLNLIYLSNWVRPVDQLCGGMTWFVSADFQIYLFVAPLIFLSYYRSTMLGLVVNFSIIICSMISSGLTTYLNELDPTVGLTHTMDLGYGYFPTWHHIAPYGMGTFIGFLILHNEQNKIHIRKSVEILMWILAPACSIFIMFCTQSWNDHLVINEYNLNLATLFSTFQRFTWVVGIAWVTFTCSIGRGGIVNRILSSQIFIPLSRLSFSIYMVHLLPIFLRANRIKYVRDWDDFTFVSWSVFNVILGTLCALLLYCVFEAPFNNLEKLLFRTPSPCSKRHRVVQPPIEPNELDSNNNHPHHRNSSSNNNSNNNNSISNNHEGGMSETIKEVQKAGRKISSGSSESGVSCDRISTSSMSSSSTPPPPNAAT